MKINDGAKSIKFRTLRNRLFKHHLYRRHNYAASRPKIFSNTGITLS